MTEFDFHPEAARAINVRGEALIDRVTRRDRKPQPARFRSQRIPHLKLMQEDIVGRLAGQRVDELANEVLTVHFEGPEGPAELGVEGVKELDKVGNLAHKYLSGKVAVAERFLRDKIIDWIQGKYRREIEESLSDFILKKLRGEVVPRTIMLPIAYLSLEEDLPFGPVEFKVITADMMDSWYEWYKRVPVAGEVATLDSWFDRLRKDTQGLAAVTYSVEADETYALQECLEKAEQAVALLRIIHPVNTSPHTALYVRPLGSENVESYYAHCYKAGLFNGYRAQVRWPFPSFWEFPKEEHGNRILQNLIHLFALKERTDFQQRLFDALLIYSKNNVAREAYEKLIFCLVAVESMLLKNASEPIQDNIGERMAYLLGNSPTERLEIEALVKRIYDIRSKFVHHGQRPTDMETLARFMKRVWVLFFHLILNMSTVSTKDEMIETLKHVKYS